MGAGHQAEMSDMRELTQLLGSRTDAGDHAARGLGVSSFDVRMNRINMSDRFERIAEPSCTALFPECLHLFFGRKPRLAGLQAFANPPYLLDLICAQSIAPVFIRDECKEDIRRGILILCR
jgi:hypothetical protein